METIHNVSHATSTSTSTIQAAKTTSSQTPSKSNDVLALAKERLVTPVTRDNLASRKRRHGSISSDTFQDNDDPSALPNLSHPAEAPRKRTKRASRWSVVQSAESRYPEQLPPAASGASKPANVEATGTGLFNAQEGAWQIRQEVKAEEGFLYPSPDALPKPSPYTSVRYPGRPIGYYFAMPVSLPTAIVDRIIITAVRQELDFHLTNATGNIHPGRKFEPCFRMLWIQSLLRANVEWTGIIKQEVKAHESTLQAQLDHAQQMIDGEEAQGWVLHDEIDRLKKGMPKLRKTLKCTKTLRWRV